MRIVAAALLLTAQSQMALAECQPVDFMTVPILQSGDPIEAALEAAYPDAELNSAAGTFTTPKGTVISFAPARDTGPAARLENATLGDMFTYVYPLDFDLTARRQAWFDPGRVRNDAFFAAMYFDTETEVRASLQRVDFAGETRQASFYVTTKYCVSTQLAAALEQIETLSPGIDIYFENSGGSFNWRVIAGTDRMSSHSFGTAIDINTELGGYWRWTGASEGQVTDYDNKIPEEVVQAMERFGFIWGGKWNNFDGMHFEYRPELILYSRLAD